MRTSIHTEIKRPQGYKWAIDKVKHKGDGTNKMIIIIYVLTDKNKSRRRSFKFDIIG